MDLTQLLVLLYINKHSNSTIYDIDSKYGQHTHRLRLNGFIVSDNKRSDAYYKLTDKSKAIIKHISNTIDLINTLDNAIQWH
jgi:DNA-binding PadR family transcriptional regulator